LRGLNPRQVEAVLHTEGPLLVLAGAGSGKTRVITCRVAQLIASGRAEPGQILAVTFTNKAANEMRERLKALIGDSLAEPVRISTFHAYCLNVLREHCEHIGYRKNFSIASEGDSRTLMRRVVDDLPTRDAFSAGIFQAEISLYKNRNEQPNAETKRPVATATEARYVEHMHDVYAKYHDALRAANSMDFDDLMLQTLRLWREHPRLGKACRDAFRYVLVDEYQDTNQVQFDLVKYLVQDHDNLCVVGDDDQSIYAWRGADTRIILDFDKHFPKAHVVTLDQNYRSTETILRAANSVIGNNADRRDKALWSQLGKGRALDWFVVEDEEAEAKQAIGWLKLIQEKTGAKWSDFAFLYRSNQQSQPLEIALRQAGISYVVVGGQDFFERAEVKDVISYLKVLVNPRDEPAFLRVINMPKRGIGDHTLHKVHDLCISKGCSLGQALAEILKSGKDDASAQQELLDIEPEFSAANQWTRTEQGISEFLSILKDFRARFQAADGRELRRVVEDLVLAIDYRGELDRTCKNKGQVESRWQNVEYVLKAVGDYAANAKEPSLRGFLDETHLVGDSPFQSKEERARKGVTLMTIHSAKGLEYPFVFLFGCEEGLMPHQKSVEQGTIEEERRLFYVALTRGKRHVTLFECLSRSKGGKERHTTTSRFLREIPEELLTRLAFAAREGMAATATEKPDAPPKDEPARVYKKPGRGSRTNQPK
jgi:superfamily I DNA/RNA helicase